MQIKYNASSEDQKIPSLGVALRNQKLHTGPSTDITQWFIFTTQHKNYIGPSPIHSDITTDSSSSNIMRSTSSMTSRTVMSKISSASLRRYALNLGPAINDGSHQSSCTKASSSFYMKQQSPWSSSTGAGFGSRSPAGGKYGISVFSIHLIS